MRRNPANLPPGAMPWGRWVEENSDSTAEAIRRQQNDSSSSGSLFSARAETVQNQISSIPSVAAIYRMDVPPFSVTRASTGATFYVYDSAVQTFNPPRPDESYDFSVIADMSASGTLFTFSYSLLRVNGVDFMFNHENTQAAYANSPTFSIMGGGKIRPGQNVQAQFALATSSTGTVTFAPTQLWCIFTGSLN